MFKFHHARQRQTTPLSIVLKTVGRARRLKTQWKAVAIHFKDLQFVNDLREISSLLQKAIENVVDILTVDVEDPECTVRCYLWSDCLDDPVNTGCIKLSDLTGEWFIAMIYRVLLSHQEFRLDTDVKFELLHTDSVRPVGVSKLIGVLGNRTIGNLREWLAKKRSMIDPLNGRFPNACIARCLVLALKLYEDPSILPANLVKCTEMDHLCKELYDLAGVELPNCSLPNCSRIAVCLKLHISLPHRCSAITMSMCFTSTAQKPSFAWGKEPHPLICFSTMTTVG